MNQPLPSAQSLPTLSIVVPVYNSAATLDELVARLETVLPGLAGEFEIILVNDGSRDESWPRIAALAAKSRRVIGVNLMRNYGQHNALLCGIRKARGTVIVTLDDDLQHPPEEIPKLLDQLAHGYDVVYGVPEKMPHSWWRNLFSYVTKRVLAFTMGISSIREVAAFRAFRSDLRRAFADYRSPNVQIDVLLSWGTTRFATVQVREDARKAGESGYTFSKLVKYALTILTGFSTAPLRFTNMIGFLFTLIGVGVFIYVLGVYFLLGSIPGFPFLASIISIFSGTQLFALGIIGEYLARVFYRSMDRPPYIIGEATGDERQPVQSGWSN
ncbi:MAG TPA: glycosyltransferase family 2 protein [Anaerolineales bacterium]|nr:glycosyltransferase family 2 protein [Anaerolineales bacterium]